MKLTNINKPSIVNINNTLQQDIFLILECGYPTHLFLKEKVLQKKTAAHGTFCGATGDQKIHPQGHVQGGSKCGSWPGGLLARQWRFCVNRKPGCGAHGTTRFS